MRPSTSIVQRVAACVDHLMGLGPKFPPITPALATISPSLEGPAQKEYGIREMIEDMSTLWGVPKYRTSKPKKQTRKFSYTRLFTPKTNIVTCGTCGSHHEADTICGTCYEKVRELTNAIKEKMMEYNPYKGDRQDKEIDVKFIDDADHGIANGKRVVELERPRPSWFKKIVE